LPLLKKTLGCDPEILNAAEKTKFKFFKKMRRIRKRFYPPRHTLFFCSISSDPQLSLCPHQTQPSLVISLTKLQTGQHKTSQKGPNYASLSKILLWHKGATGLQSIVL
jgi:hypothetical protein